MPKPHVAPDPGLILACANVWAHLAGSDDPELIALANECHEALTRASVEDGSGAAASAGDGGMNIGTLVRFRHQREGGPVHRVTAIDGSAGPHNGMIELNDMGGYFAPHLFEEATDIGGIPLDGTRVESEIERLTKELKRVKALCAQMADQGVYSDSYGVHGSDFQCCKCCTAGGSPGVLFEHDAECPVGRSEEIVDEWFSEMKENADEIDRFRREKAELVEAAGRLLNPEFQDNVEEEINRQHQGDCTIIEAVTIAFELSGMSAAIRKITASDTEQG